ncbi:MAG: hypothetical protein AB7I27_00100 [Bacteriovoracaceae bacterium]
MNQYFELQQLYNHLSRWCEILSQHNYPNFAERFRHSFQRIHESFSGDNNQRYMALLDFQDSFKGGMGSVNDISIADDLFWKAVEEERDLLVRKYYDIVVLQK